jgi:hypothetical protein
MANTMPVRAIMPELTDEKKASAEPTEIFSV